VQIVDRDHGRLLGADVHRQPVQAVDHGEHSVAGRCGRRVAHLALERDQRPLRGAGEQCPPLLPASPGQHGLEQLPRDSK
jgi:hypothetical protein